MARKEIILSIYIATYNRKEILLRKIKDLLGLKLDEFDIWVLDDCSSDGTFDALNQVEDEKLHIIHNTTRQGVEEDGAMPNWYKLLESVDGLFAFHLNDRDNINVSKLNDFINFLKTHKDASGGLCDSFKKIEWYETPVEALNGIPYKGSHPTGVVFNMHLYHKIKERQSIFTKKGSYIHPHDLILGYLSQYGNMFLYYKIWELAGQKSFASNKSFLYNKGNAQNAWFAPQERMKEYKLFLRSLSRLKFSNEEKQQKAKQISKSYLYFCTFNYAYYISDPGQTKHYGIEPVKLRRKDYKNELTAFLNRSTETLKEYSLLGSEKEYRKDMTEYFWKIYIGKPVWDLYKKVANRKW